MGRGFEKKKKAICVCEVFWLPNSIFNQKHLTTSTLESSACQREYCEKKRIVNIIISDFQKVPPDVQ